MKTPRKTYTVVTKTSCLGRRVRSLVEARRIARLWLSFKSSVDVQILDDAGLSVEIG